MWGTFKYQVWKPAEFFMGDYAKATMGLAGKGLGHAAWWGARKGGSMAWGAGKWGAKNVLWPAAVETAKLGTNAILQAGHVLKNWGMDKTWSLFQKVDNPSIVDALKYGASTNTLKKLGYVVERNEGEAAEAFFKRQFESTKKWTFNPTLRKRILQGTAAVVAIQSLRSMNNGGWDPRIPVNDTTGTRGNLGGDGDLALSMYYNNR